MTRRCIDRVYCLSDRAAIYAPAFCRRQKTLICMQVNYQEAANRQALVTIAVAVVGFRFSVQISELFLHQKEVLTKLRCSCNGFPQKKQYYLSKESLSLIKAHL